MAFVIDGGSKKGFCTIQIKDWVSEVMVANLKRGNIKYPYHPSVCDNGYFGEGKHKAKVNGKNTKVYDVWNSMMKRCYDNKRPTYKDCSVSPRWLNFQVFGDWFENNYIIGFELDKDLLIKGNKVYSEETCTFIPQCLNKFIANNRICSADGCSGVTWHKRDKKWVAQISDVDNNTNLHLGYFHKQNDAVDAYKRARITMAHKLKHEMMLKYGITDLKILDSIDKLGGGLVWG